MSYYNVYPDPTIDYLVCSVCDAATFTWLADVFPCLVCGSDNFVSVESEATAAQPVILYSEADIQEQLLEEYREEIRRCGTEIGQIGIPEEGGDEEKGARKRKRSGDDGDRGPGKHN